MASFVDDFDRADSTNLGAGWVEVSGDWSIISNRLSSGSAGGTIILRAAGAMATSDHSVQVTIAATASVSHGIWARGNSNITSGYLFRNDGSSWDLFSVVGGSFSVIGSYAAAAAASDVAKLQVVGSAIKCFVNGVQRISVTDTSVATGTSVGIRAESTSSLRFDDFTAADVTAGATLPIAAESDSAIPLAGAKSTTLAPTTETDAAQTVTGTKTAALPTASEQNTAQALTGTKSATLNPTAETDAAQTLTGTKAGSLGAATGNESALPLTGSKATTLQPAAETDSAQAFSGAPAVTLPVAASEETALPLTGSKAATLTPALEIDTARQLAPPSTATPSRERTYTIPAEPRRLLVDGEPRRLAVPAENRTLIVR